MKTSIKTSCLTLFVMLNLVAVECFAADVRDQPRKDGILLVAFGSSEKTAQVSFDTIERMVKRAYSGIPVRWAYTSHVIREKLAKQGTFLDSPETALAKMQDEAFTHVAVQSLHTIGGAEFHDLYRTVDAFERMGGFRKLILGYPLMTTQEDMEKVVAAVRASIPEERSKEDAVLLMGHGTHHPSNALYAALMFQLQRVDPNIFVGTVEGYPEVDLLKELLLEKGIKKAYLMPFMSVAGDHAKNDMAGDGDDSWVSILTRAGIACVPVLKGTAEFDEFAVIWIDHVGESLRSLDK
ncbi:sirohydrochlorin cobaltochelatase [Prosthecochloris sp. SCSIO W1101]|uniref:sirohydrochlorin cobaltochelatase n=1 Tax=Prosthecochloris sp. SCSIO W1101 TaxID=2992242 RepID=UPI00223E5258|nr:sirohydrochlorin cobaltochelatase [Prosthecochloris sp. SCSIO W1101]UZJ40188.1 sirohydrochlorin cobaltochelatase [Prosthecochloris sp. SCSIO W1101]